MTNDRIIPDGFYEGKLLDYGIRMTKSTNQPSVTAIFQVIHDGASYNIFWQGTFKGRDGKSNETTLNALITMGMSDVNRISDIAAQKASGALDTKKTYNLKIQVDYNEVQGRSYNKVAFVNEVGSGNAFKDLVSPMEFLPMVGSLGIAGDFQRLISNRSNDGPKKNPTPNSNYNLADDIAF